MTSISYLQNCPKDQITVELVLDLMSQELPEGLSLEYKEKYSTGVIETIAAFANTHGGLIIVGVKDEIVPNRVVGVAETELTKISNACSDLLDPPFTPEIIPLRLPGPDPKFLLLIRVYPEKTTRPVAIRGKVWVRLNGNNDGADSYRLRELFGEGAPPSVALNLSLSVPNVPNETPPIDLFIRTGVVLPVDINSAGRPLSETKVRELTGFLNASVLSARLTSHISQLGIENLNTFRKEGFNRARYVRLSWQGIYLDGGVQRFPVESVVTLNSTTNGVEPATTMQVTVDFILRQSALLISRDPRQFPLGTIYPISIVDIYEDVVALVKTVIDPRFKEIVAEIGGVEAQQIPRPMTLGIFFPNGVTQTLRIDSLREIPGSGTSQGSTLIGDNSLDLSDESELNQQVDQWIIQLALDGSLEGTEDLLNRYHRAHP